MSKYYVYVLVDGFAEEPLYVGQTMYPEARMASHLNKAILRKTFKDQVIADLMWEGIGVEMQIVAELDSLQEAYDYEAKLIRLLRQEYSLLNISSGWSGGSANMSAEANERRFSKLRGRKQTPESVLKRKLAFSRNKILKNG